jgi:hypothetical protein
MTYRIFKNGLVIALPGLRRIPSQHNSPSFDFIKSTMQLSPIQTTRSNLTRSWFYLSQHIKAGGTLVMLFHKIEWWIQYCFCKHLIDFLNFVFKLKKCYAIGLRFILLRKNIQPYNDDTKTAVKLYKCSDKPRFLGRIPPFWLLIS